MDWASEVPHGFSSLLVFEELEGLGLVAVNLLQDGHALLEVIANMHALVQLDRHLVQMKFVLLTLGSRSSHHLQLHRDGFSKGIAVGPTEDHAEFVDLV